MVEDRLSDGKRIAELLSSELTGLAVGPLADVTVTDADPAVEPTDGGALAYRISHEGTAIGSVFVSPSEARLAFEDSDAESLDLAEIVERVGHPGLTLVVPGNAGDEDDGADDSDGADDGDGGNVDVVAVRIESGAAVKAAVDVLRAALEDERRTD